MKKASVIIILVLILTAVLSGCGGEDQQSSSKDFDFSGTYTGTQTVTEAKNSAQGEVTETKMVFTQNDDGTAKIAFGEEEKEGAVGTYNKDTGEFFYDTGGDVSLQVNLKFTVDGDAATAKGTITTNQTDEGWTQEVALDFKRQ